jgi:hypothetical protein
MGTQEKPDLEWILANIPLNLLGNHTQSREVRIIYLSDLFKKRMTMQGSDSGKMCIACYHPGHDDFEDLDLCPAARLTSYAKLAQQPYRVGSGPYLELKDGFFFDLLLLGKGYDWALETLKEGDGGTFGITITAVQETEYLLSLCTILKNSGLVVPRSFKYPELKGDIKVYFCHYFVPWHS